jgi:hypothetical protein
VRSSLNGLSCWGDDEYGKATPPAGRFVQVSAGTDTTCGIVSGGTVSCWGRPIEPVPADPIFTKVVVGNRYACARSLDRRLVCWGENYYGQATPPSGTFDDIAAGDAFACAITTDDHVRCWGRYVWESL